MFGKRDFGLDFYDVVSTEFGGIFWSKLGVVLMFELVGLTDCKIYHYGLFWKNLENYEIGKTVLLSSTASDFFEE